MRPSRTLHAALVLVVALAALAFAIADFGAGFAVLVVLVGVFEAWRLWRTRLPTRLVLTSDGRWTVVVADADWRASLVEAVELGPLLTMTLRGDDGRLRRFALLPDSADRDELRRLRVWLRHPQRGEPPKRDDPPG